MMNKYNLVSGQALLMAVLLLLFTACRDQQSHTGHTHEQVVTQEIPQEFLKFYMNFLSDTTYQKDHIIFPLKQQADGSMWTKDDWVCHQPYKDNDTYQQQFSNLNGLILETIADGNGMYRMERRYMQSDDSYALIYFSVMNAFDNSDDWSKEQ